MAENDIIIEPFGMLPEGNRNDEYVLVIDGTEIGPFGRDEIDQIRRSKGERHNGAITVRLIGQAPGMSKLEALVAGSK